MTMYPEYTHGPQQVVVDLDATLAEDTWPLRHVIGEPIPEGVAWVKHYAALGFSVCVYTARPAVDEPLIWEWLLTHGIPCDKVRTDKPVGFAYLDDRAVRFERSKDA